MVYTYYYESPLGEICLTSNGSELTGLCFCDQVCLMSEYAEQNREGELPIFRQTADWLDTYFNSQIPNFTPPLSMKATSFRETVWKILLTISYGETVTYGEIARKLAEKDGKAKMSAQAVGGAVAHNPILLIIPCHRVVGARDEIVGYAGGVDRKAKLLELENKNSPHCGLKTLTVKSS